MLFSFTREDRTNYRSDSSTARVGRSEKFIMATEVNTRRTLLEVNIAWSGRQLLKSTRNNSVFTFAS